MREIFATVLAYAGLALMLAGAVCVIRPLRFLRIRTRRAAVIVLGAGVVIFFVAMALPAEMQRATKPESRLDEWMPEWQFSEFHSTQIHAAPERIYRAIREVSGDEILLLRTLTWIRNPRWPGSGKESIMNPPKNKPILDAAMAGGFRLAADAPPGEIVLLTLVMRDSATRPSRNDAEGLRELMHRPGNALAAMNFRVRDDGNGWCTVTTETRVFATDDAARRSFAHYWRIIYPGSSLLRYTWLRAIRIRAEK